MDGKSEEYTSVTLGWESGGLSNPYDAVAGTVDSDTGTFTPGGTFDQNNVTGQTLKFNDGTEDRIVTIKGNNQTTTVGLKNYYDRDAFNFVILKVAAGTAKTLSGASFTIQPVKESSNTTEPEYKPGSSQSAPKTTGDNGKACFTDITADYYEVKETKPPDEYIFTGEDSFYIRIDAAGIKLLKKEVKDGRLSLIEAASAKVNNVTIDTQGTTVTFTVENTPGTALPNTGGPGTRPFTIPGSILLAAAAALQMRRRRR